MIYYSIKNTKSYISVLSLALYIAEQNDKEITETKTEYIKQA